MWKNSKNYYDLKAEDQMLEIKMNRVVQQQPHSQTSSHNSTTSSTSSFFDKQKNRSMQSDQTSVMDAQHGPGVQLKYAIFSLLLFVFICTNAAALITLNNAYNNTNDSTSTASRTEQLIIQLLAYSLSILIFMLSVCELSFYVLSRSGDLMQCGSGDGEWKNNTFLCVLNLGGNNDSRTKDSYGTEIDEDEHEKIHRFNDQNNLYFEPKSLLLSSPDNNGVDQKSKLKDYLPMLAATMNNQDETNPPEEASDYYGEVNNTANLTSYNGNNNTRHISISDTLFSSVTNQTTLRPPTPPHHSQHNRVPQPPPMPPPPLNESTTSSSSSSSASNSADSDTATKAVNIPKSKTAIPLATQEETVEESEEQDDKDDHYHYQYNYNYNGKKNQNKKNAEHGVNAAQRRRAGGKMANSSSDLGHYYEQKHQPTYQMRKQTSSASGRMIYGTGSKPQHETPDTVYSQIPTNDTSMASTNRLLGSSHSNSSITNKKPNQRNSKSKLLNDLMSGNKWSATQAVGAAIDFVHVPASNVTISQTLPSTKLIESVLKSSSGASSNNEPIDSVISSMGSMGVDSGIHNADHITNNKIRISHHGSAGIGGHSGRSSSRDEAITTPSTTSSLSQSQSSSQVNSASNLAAYQTHTVHDGSSGEYVYSRVTTTLGRVHTRVVEPKLNASHSHSPLLNASTNSQGGVRTSIFRPKEIEPKHETSV
jgi:hypothetical protein